MSEFKFNKCIPNLEFPKNCNNNNFITDELTKINSTTKIILEPAYRLAGYKYALPIILMHSKVYDKLLEASKLLPDGYKFKIWDAWRPFNLQQELYDTYYEQIIKAHKIEHLNKEEQDKFVSQFVSKPVKNIEDPPVHTTGGAIDLTIVDNFGKELNMGTAFDSFSSNTATSYYERHYTNSNNQNIIRDNRRLLYNVMVTAGFSNLPSEWWHYDYGDKFWSYYKKQPSMYSGIFDIKVRE